MSHTFPDLGKTFKNLMELLIHILINKENIINVIEG